MEIIRQHTSDGALADLEYALELLDAVRRGERGGVIRIYRPEPTMAFGQRDARLPGFSAACRVAQEHGFTPVIRKAGGRAMPYHRECIVVDHLEPEPDAILASRQRFARFGEDFAAVLRSFDVNAAVGEIPGEYCPGQYSVHGGFPDGRKIKLVGTAQRIVSGAWLFSSAIVIDNAEPLRSVLEACYAELGLSWDPGTVGAVRDVNPSVRISDIEEAVLVRLSAAQSSSASSLSSASQRRKSIER